MKIIDLLNKIANGDDYCNLSQCLNDEVEIIEDTPKEDKKIEKISLSTTEGEPMPLYTGTEVTIIEKINKIIDILNKEK